MTGQGELPMNCSGDLRRSYTPCLRTTFEQYCRTNVLRRGCLGKSARGPENAKYIIDQTDPNLMKFIHDIFKRHYQQWKSDVKPNVETPPAQ
ncbi:hypothetical protein C1H46_030386 [Malus baccata]|uniref:Uncharacterized protein n=1 Tax=Malus baccata TaxID=106549 RepID=A0A540LC65_MALBA|nr:hypothetical protein C1H46_030386 [Malus baccata]